MIRAVIRTKSDKKFLDKIKWKRRIKMDKVDSILINFINNTTDFGENEKYIKQAKSELKKIILTNLRINVDLSGIEPKYWKQVCKVIDELYGE